jgi:hypothetical protein
MNRETDRMIELERAGPLRERIDVIEAENVLTTAALAQADTECKRLRAANKIEWEPGRSYTAAELLRRAIRGLHVRKGRPLWPAVMNLCGVGSTVGCYLCRWAGRDPDTGKEIDAARAARGEG